MRGKAFAALLALAVALPAMAGQKGPGPRMGHGGPEGFNLMAAGGRGKVVTGAPYSAQATTVFTQTLADGNVITHTNSSNTARDSAGRTMTQGAFGMIGPWSRNGGASNSIVIHDPTTSTVYMLNSANKTARKMVHQPRSTNATGATAGTPGTPGARGQRGMRHAPSTDGTTAATATTPRPGRPNSVTESLGTQTMEGVSVTGTRVTTTFAVGAIGNAKEINIVSERWYSADLQVVVKSTRTDPRNGTTVYQLTGIKRAEPDASLFQVPADYTVQTAGPRRGPGAPPVATPAPVQNQN